MVVIGSGAKRHIDTILMSRYACYLAVQNADPRKAIVAQGQTYFAVQTRRQEIEDELRLEEEIEDDRRLLLRDELRRHNTQLFTPILPTESTAYRTEHPFLLL